MEISVRIKGISRPKSTMTGPKRRNQPAAMSISSALKAMTRPSDRRDSARASARRRPAKCQGSMPTTAPTVAAASTPNRLRSPLAAAKPARNDQFRGYGRKDRFSQHDEENPQISEFGNGLDNPVGHAAVSLLIGRVDEVMGKKGPRRFRGAPLFYQADLAARLMRLRSFGSSQILRRRIDFGVTSTYSSSAI